MEKVKTFTAIERFTSNKSDHSFGYETSLNSERMASHIDNSLTKQYDAWLVENPNVDIIDTKLDTHLGVSQPSTSFTYAAIGWMAYAATLVVKYRDKR